MTYICRIEVICSGHCHRQCSLVYFRWHWRSAVFARLDMWCDRGYPHQKRLLMLQRPLKVAMGVVRHFRGRVVVVKDIDLLRILPVAFDVLKSWIIVLISM